MVEARKIAIIVRDSGHIDELPAILHGFCSIFQYIQVFLVRGDDTDADSVSKATRDRIRECEAAYFADDPEKARQYGFRYTSIAEMAPMLRMFDAVIPM